MVLPYMTLRRMLLRFVGMLGNRPVDDAAIHYIGKAVVEEDDSKDRMKKEVADTENVVGATIHDSEKAAVEIRGNAGK